MILFCPENTIPRIPKSGNDILMFIQTIVQRSDIQCNIRMLLFHLLHAFRRGDDTYKTDMLHAFIF